MKPSELRDIMYRAERETRKVVEEKADARKRLVARLIETNPAMPKTMAYEKAKHEVPMLEVQEHEIASIIEGVFRNWMTDLAEYEKDMSEASMWAAIHIILFAEMCVRDAAFTDEKSYPPTLPWAGRKRQSPNPKSWAVMYARDEAEDTVKDCLHHERLCAKDIAALLMGWVRHVFQRHKTTNPLEFAAIEATAKMAKDRYGDALNKAIVALEQKQGEPQDGQAEKTAQEMVEDN